MESFYHLSSFYLPYPAGLIFFQLSNIYQQWVATGPNNIVSWPSMREFRPRRLKQFLIWKSVFIDMISFHVDSWQILLKFIMKSKVRAFKDYVFHKQVSSSLL